MHGPATVKAERRPRSHKDRSKPVSDGARYAQHGPRRVPDDDRDGHQGGSGERRPPQALGSAAGDDARETRVEAQEDDEAHRQHDALEEKARSVRVEVASDHVFRRVRGWPGWREAERGERDARTHETEDTALPIARGCKGTIERFGGGIHGVAEATRRPALRIAPPGFRAPAARRLPGSAARNARDLAAARWLRRPRGPFSGSR